MTRFEEITELLDRRKFFKLVCGAGNEDACQVKKLVFVYSLAGAKGFDVSANVEVVRQAVLAIEEATSYAKHMQRKLTIRPFIKVSIGMRGDPHVRRAKITNKCAKCGACAGECPQGAISSIFEVNAVRCIGCGGCESACRFGAVEFYHNKKHDLPSLLRKCKAAGAEQMELHAAVFDDKSIFEEWKMLNGIITDNYLSMCLDRFHLSDAHLRRRIKQAKEITGERFMIQADGVPMSGGRDDYNTTLQAIATADIVAKSKLDAKVLLSGGTNSLTAQLADMCSVNWHGISVGTFGRKLIRPLIDNKDFFASPGLIRQAVDMAQKLVTDNIGEIIW